MTEPTELRSFDNQSAAEYPHSQIDDPWCCDTCQRIAVQAGDDTLASALGKWDDDQ